MQSTICISACSLNQSALDFHGNFQRILESIRKAKEATCRIRSGPELEITGYGCNDHFLELDTVHHSWEVLCKLLLHPDSQGILIDVGMPVAHRHCLYNCRVFAYDGKILLIRPKMTMANDGNYRELRWFTPWTHPCQVEEFQLPRIASQKLDQDSVPFGDAILRSQDGVLMGVESCEELFTPLSPHVSLGLNGVDIILNGSASHHEFSKLKTRVDLMKNVTSKNGGIYVYSNLVGCDGERVYYDGCSLISCNGDIVAQGDQFTLKEVQLVTAWVDLESVRSYRMTRSSRCLQSSIAKNYPIVHIPACLCIPSQRQKISPPLTCQFPLPEQEIRFGPAAWLWDYLRKSKSGGFFLPLSGGIDSCATALIVVSMCQMVMKEYRLGNKTVIDYLRFLYDNSLPKNEKELCYRLLSTCFMGFAHSSQETKTRSRVLAQSIGSNHLECSIDSVVSSFIHIFSSLTGLVPQFKVYGGTGNENLALQNLQARTRMVLAYFLAQLIPWTQGMTKGFLVLGSANVDETLRGYFTKYDCSSADLNPIGGISKANLNLFIRHMRREFPILQEFLEAIPSAELEPVTDNYVQTDEQDMGISYQDLSLFGTLRKVHRCGPVSMFYKLQSIWNSVPLDLIASKVKTFFTFYGMNRHKTTTLPPSYHMSAYSPDDNRFDLRPILYSSSWTWQFEHLDEILNSNLNTESSEIERKQVNS